MVIEDEGHIYKLDNQTTIGNTCTLTFYKDSETHNNGHLGTSNQEVLRALIDRVKYLDNEDPNPLNKEIIRNLRETLILHEIKHLEDMVKTNHPVEKIKPYVDGHLIKPLD